MKEGSKRYKALLDEALDLHVRKNVGYASQNPDAFANFRLAEGMGLTPVQGVMVRLGDKFARAQSLMSNPENDKVGESLRDTLMDLSAYALIAICLMEEKVEDLAILTSKDGTFQIYEDKETVERKQPEIKCCLPACESCPSDCQECLYGCLPCRPVDPEDLMC